MTHQSSSLFAAIYISDFPAQAIIRLRPELRSHAVAILDGTPPQERVCSLNQSARKRGVIPEMTRLEVEELGGIYLQSRSHETEHAAMMVVLEIVSQFSPRIQESPATNACSFVLDIIGTERLFGSSDIFAKRIQSSIHSAGFRASIAVSHNFDTARIKAAFSQGITIVPQNLEASSLATIPISALSLDVQEYETFAMWGIGCLGELSKLPEEELITGLGQRSKHWLKLARGVEEHIFVPIEAEFELKEHIEFETHLDQLDSLLFVAATMISSLITRASSRALSLATLIIHMDLEKEAAYERMIRPAIPTTDRKFLLKLLQLEISAHPPQSAITSLSLTAEAGHQGKVQLGLFVPQTPEPSRLDVTIARLKALLGEDRVGSPKLEDSHRTDSFVMQDFSVVGPPNSAMHTNVTVSLRRMRPPRPIRMHLQCSQPAFFHEREDRYAVQVAYGPWLTSGCWWSDNEWDLEEWDVLATNHLGESIGCLIVHDNLKKQWLLDAMYD